MGGTAIKNILLVAFIAIGAALMANAFAIHGGPTHVNGTYEGEWNGTYDGTATGTVTMGVGTVQVVREFMVHAQTQQPSSTGDHAFNIDPSPFELGDVDASKSKTVVEVFAFTGSTDPNTNTNIVVTWFEPTSGQLHQVSNCGTSSTDVRIEASGTAAAGGAGESRQVCTLDSYRTGSFTITASVGALTETFAPKVGITVWQTQVVNETRVTSSGTTTHTESGTLSGEENGTVELPPTTTENITNVNNQTVENQTFESGSTQNVDNQTVGNQTMIESPLEVTNAAFDFWFPVLILLALLILAWRKGNLWVAAGATFGILVFVLTDFVFNKEFAVLVIILGGWLTFFAKGKVMDPDNV